MFNIPFYTYLSDDNDAWVRDLKDTLGEATTVAALNRFLDSMRLSRKSAIEIMDIIDP